MEQDKLINESIVDSSQPNSTSESEKLKMLVEDASISCPVPQESIGEIHSNKGFQQIDHFNQQTSDESVPDVEIMKFNSNVPTSSPVLFNNSLLHNLSSDSFWLNKRKYSEAEKRWALQLSLNSQDENIIPDKNSKCESHEEFILENNISESIPQSPQPLLHASQLLQTSQSVEPSPLNEQAIDKSSLHNLSSNSFEPKQSNLIVESGLIKPEVSQPLELEKQSAEKNIDLKRNLSLDTFWINKKKYDNAEKKLYINMYKSDDTLTNQKTCEIVPETISEKESYLNLAELNNAIIPKEIESNAVFTTDLYEGTNITLSKLPTMPLIETGAKIIDNLKLDSFWLNKLRYSNAEKIWYESIKPDYLSKMTASPESSLRIDPISSGASLDAQQPARGQLSLKVRYRKARGLTYYLFLAFRSSECLRTMWLCLLFFSIYFLFFLLNL
jgi:hypothetical protein